MKKNKKQHVPRANGILICLVAAACGGKNTQARGLRQLGFGEIEVSTLLAGLRKTDPTAHSCFERAGRTGLLVPDRIMLPLLDQATEKALASQHGTSPHGLILNGGARTLKQAEQLLHIAERNNLALVTFFIDTPLDVCELRRSQRWIESGQGKGRPDDAPTVFSVRLNQYRDYTLPAVRLLKQTAVQQLRGPMFSRIDGNRPPEEVFVDISGHVDHMAEYHGIKLCREQQPASPPTAGTRHISLPILMNQAV